MKQHGHAFVQDLRRLGLPASGEGPLRPVVDHAGVPRLAAVASKPLGRLHGRAAAEAGRRHGHLMKLA